MNSAPGRSLGLKELYISVIYIFFRYHQYGPLGPKMAREKIRKIRDMALA